MATQHYFYFICNLLTIYGLNRFFKKTYTSPSRMLSIIGLITFYVVDGIITIINSKPTIFFFSSLVTFLLLSLAYSYKFSLSNILSTIILQVFSVCSELIASFVVSLSVTESLEYSNEAIIILTIIIAKIIFYLFLIIASLVLRNSGTGSISAHLIGLFIMPSISILQIMYIFRLHQFDQNTILGSGSIDALLAVFSIVIINIVSCFGIDQQRKISSVENEKNRLSTVIKMQSEYYEQERKNREHIQRMRHDFKNFLLGIRSDIASGDVNNAILIIDSQLKNDSFDTLSKSNLLAVDSVLSYKGGQAKELGITIIPQFKITSEPHIESSDISILIGNALDNAIEYLSAHCNCKQTISFRMVYDKGILDISIENEVERPFSTPRNNQLVSTKDPSHGYGIKSAEYITQKYSGKLIISCKSENTFSFCAILYC